LSDKYTLANIIKEIRNFKGFTRKAILGDLLNLLGEKTYDDAGALEIGKSSVVVSADGIVDAIVKDDPWLAGYYSVLVNVNDVVAKGAYPKGYACVLSSSSYETRRKIVQGIKYGLEKYGLKFLKAHTHPDTSIDAIDGFVVGLAKNFLSCTDALPEDDLLVAIDLDGKFGAKGWVKTFDSTMHKSSIEIAKQIQAVVSVAEKKLANSSRDISGPSIIGSLAMLCESSRVGAQVNLETIPKPQNIELKDWLTTYPSTGFLFTTRKTEQCKNVLENAGFAVSIMGKILKNREIQLSLDAHVEIFMNLNEESVFGFHKTKG
jgi:selenophosphate synthetase-related protein